MQNRIRLTVADDSEAYILRREITSNHLRPASIVPVLRANKARFRPPATIAPLFNKITKESHVDPNYILRPAV